MTKTMYELAKEFEMEQMKKQQESQNPFWEFGKITKEEIEKFKDFEYAKVFLTKEGEKWLKEKMKN